MRVQGTGSSRGNGRTAFPACVPQSNIGVMETGAPELGFRDVRAIVKASALQRLGKPLLLTDLALGACGGAVVAASVLAMWLEPR